MMSSPSVVRHRNVDALAGSISIVSDPRRKEQLAKLAKQGAKQIKATVVASSPTNKQRVFSIKEKIYCLFDPSATMPSRAFATASTGIAILILFLILVSVAVFMIASLPRFEGRSSPALDGLEMGCVMVFTIEFTARFATTPDRHGFITDIHNWIDIAAVLPFWIEAVLQLTGLGGEGAGTSFVVLRLLRLVRVLRVFKLGQYSRPLQMVLFTLARSVTALSLLVFLLGIGTVLFSSLLFIAEQSENGQSFDEKKRMWVRKNGDRSPFQSIPHCFWWAMVTLTTVGYGDDVPTSLPGKLVGSLCILVGLLVVAFPVILISHNFQQVMSEVEQVEREHLEREGSMQAVLSGLLPGEGDSRPAQLSGLAHDGGLDEVMMLPPGVLSRTESGTQGPQSTGGSGGTLGRQQAWGRAEEQHPQNPLNSPGLDLSTPRSPGGTLVFNSKGAEWPPLGTPVANFRYDQRGKPKTIFFHGLIGDLPQFRYDPLFLPLTNTVGEIDVIRRSNEQAGHHFIHFEICLDTERAQSQCLDVAARSGLGTKRLGLRGSGLCCSRQLRRVTLRVPHLPDGCSLSNDVWFHPNLVIPIHVRTRSAETLGLLLRVIPDLTLHFTCVWAESHSLTRQVTEAAIDAAVLAGVLSPEEAVQKRMQLSSDSDEVFEVSVPLRQVVQPPEKGSGEVGSTGAEHQDSVLYEDLKEALS
eukprot:Hpha_TRINITY_DN13147_c0_g1::TRINITY_DN13147_c0_g1_i1::g.113777::m.113777